MVGMSGGVDSSVAAAQLLDAGKRVTGLFMKNWEEDDDPQYCAAAEDLADAERVCKQLGIELRTINFSHEYWERVFRVFLSEYRNGRTPNPDVLCNKEIKFKEFLEWAGAQGAARIATGHYARIARDGNHCLLLKGLDRNKDQSYFLHTLDQTALSRAAFPLGAMQKNEVRAMARQLNLAVHNKKDSTGLCFIGERRFDEFLARFLPAQKGAIKTLDGKTLGQHCGAFHYTIGQRRLLDIGGAGDAWYVTDKDTARNIVYVVQGHDNKALNKRVVLIDHPHWIADAARIGVEYTAQTRYRQAEQPCVITELNRTAARIEFAEAQRAPAPGQSLVLYCGEVCLGGGVIRAAHN